MALKRVARIDESELQVAKFLPGLGDRLDGPLRSLFGLPPLPPNDASDFDFATIMAQLLDTLDVTFLLDMAEEFEEAVPGPAQALFVPAITAMRIKIMIEENLDEMLEEERMKENTEGGVVAEGGKFGGVGDDTAKRKASLTKTLSSKGKLSLRQQKSARGVETMTAQVSDLRLSHIACRSVADNMHLSARSDSMKAWPGHLMSHRILRHHRGPPQE